MKYVKILGLTVVTALATMALAGTASATVATSPEGTAYTGPIKAESEKAHVDLTGPLGLHLQCSSSGEGKLESHGASNTVRGPIQAFPFANCTNGYHVTTIKGKEGELEVHTEGGNSNGNGTLTSSNSEFEVIVPMGTTCIYKTNNTHVGTITGSNVTGGKATADIKALVPRTGGSALCGSVGELQASYLITTPSTLYID